MKEVYQLKITLRGIEPKIWRRILVPSTMSLPRFHRVIQATMGWLDYHLHQFIADGVCYGVPDPDGLLETNNERYVKLSRLLKHEGDRIIYEYDFGDSWEHEIKLEKRRPFGDQVALPVCLAGDRARPPEDCGGIHGYQHLLEVIMDPGHEEHEDMLTWVGDGFGPENFDIDEINDALSRLTR
jgi:hypothetical protein